MPIALLIVAIAIMVAAFRGTHKELGALVTQEFSGEQSFLYWLAAVGIIGSVGYIPAFRSTSRAFLALVIISFVLANSGVFDKLVEAIQGRGR